MAHFGVSPGAAGVNLEPVQYLLKFQIYLKSLSAHFLQLTLCCQACDGKANKKAQLDPDGHGWGPSPPETCSPLSSPQILNIRSEWVSGLGSHNEVFQNCLLVVVQDDATGARGSSPPSPHRDPDAEEVTGWTDQHFLLGQVPQLT